MSRPHITVCVCTYRRPEWLDRLLSGLVRQQTGGRFDYSIAVVDNDRAESARATAERRARQSSVTIGYWVEREQNIALARNLAVARATGDYVAFIDDDEEPFERWLLSLYTTLARYEVDGVLAPVEPRFEAAAARWAVRSGIFHRPRFATGQPIDWRVTGTGNVLLKRTVLLTLGEPFRRQFASGGEDVDFFRRAMDAGYVFIWDDTAVVYETVPVERTRLWFQLRRALLRGKVAMRGPSGRWPGVLKSALACGVYTLMLPVFLVRGPHVFVKYLIKDFDHLGKLMALCGIDAAGDKYLLK